MSSDLRAVLEAVLEEPLVDARPVEDVLRHGRRVVARHRRRRAVARFAVLVAITTLGLQAVLFDRSNDRLRVTDGPKPPVETTTTVPTPVPFHPVTAERAEPEPAPSPP